MEKIKESRGLSFLAIAAIYIIALAVGVSVYFLTDLPWQWSLLIADVAATLVTFLFSLIFGNASVYDPYWSVQPPVILIAFALVYGLNALSLLTLLVVTFWAVRLTANWAYTFKGLSHQDWRYTMLKERTGKFYPVINLVGIHMVPTLLVYFCTLPAAHLIVNPKPLMIGNVIALGISLAAAGMQGVADMQMHAFRKKKETTFIRVGLWKHSRHPNYLGEILMWWGVGLSLAIADTPSRYLLIGAVLNTLLFLFVSIPMADKRQSKKMGFEEYKKETRMLLPIKKGLK